MKLYTEDQVFNLFENFQLHLPFHYELLLKEHINSLTPIELPSDEEIDKGASDVFLFGADQGKFIAGANWVIEQIEQQSNGK